MLFLNRSNSFLLLNYNIKGRNPKTETAFTAVKTEMAFFLIYSLPYARRFGCKIINYHVHFPVYFLSTKLETLNLYRQFGINQSLVQFHSSSRTVPLEFQLSILYRNSRLCFSLSFACKLCTSRPLYTNEIHAPLGHPFRVITFA